MDVYENESSALVAPLGIVNDWPLGMGKDCDCVCPVPLKGSVAVEVPPAIARFAGVVPGDWGANLTVNEHPAPAVKIAGQELLTIEYGALTAGTERVASPPPEFCRVTARSFVLRSPTVPNESALGEKDKFAGK